MPRCPSRFQAGQLWLAGPTPPGTLFVHEWRDGRHSFALQLAWDRYVLWSDKLLDGSGRLGAGRCPGNGHSVSWHRGRFRAGSGWRRCHA